MTRLGMSIYESDGVYPSHCLTLGEKLNRGELINVDGEELLGAPVSRAELILLRDDFGHIYGIQDVCLTQQQDPQVNAICSNCELFWYRKYVKREYKLIAESKEHDVLFDSKLLNLSKELEYLESGNNPLKASKYLSVTGGYMEDLSLLDNKMIIELNEDLSYMTGTLKKVSDDDDLLFLAIVDTEDNLNFNGGILYHDEIKEAVAGENPVDFFVDASHSIDNVLSEWIAII